MKLTPEQEQIIAKYCDQYHNQKSESLPWNSLFQLIAYNFMFAEKMSGKSLDLNQFIKDLRKPMKTLVKDMASV